MNAERYCHRLAFVNGKGGCGKTTSLFNVAGVLSSQGDKVLVVDLDKQRNATESFLMNAERPEKTVYDFFMGKASLDEAVSNAYCIAPRKRNPQYYNVDCVVSDSRLSNEKSLRKIDIENVRDEFNSFVTNNHYDWVLVDMPPSSETINNICFSALVDYCIIPFSSDGYSVDGYGDLSITMNKAREQNPDLNILGVFLSRYQTNSAIDNFIRSQIEEFGDIYIPVQIPFATDVREAILFGRPISFYKTTSKSKTAYESLVKEIRERIAMRQA